MLSQSLLQIVVTNAILVAKQTVIIHAAPVATQIAVNYSTPVAKRNCSSI